MTSTTTNEAIDRFHWLLSQFAENTAGIEEAVAVSTDGIVLGASAGLNGGNVDQFAAVTAGLTSLTKGASDMFDLDGVRQIVVEMGRGYLFVTSISEGSALAALTAAEADLALVGYEITLLVQRVGRLLTPELIKALKNTLGR
jgi:predicted regulator of Ras-like GTPase activity (Roadblock/LC7/MglB family)